MTIRAFGRHFREGLKNLVRNGWMTFAAMTAVMITLAIVGMAMMIALNAEQMSHYVANQLEVSAYLKQNLNSAEGEAVATDVRRLPDVKSVVVVTKSQGLKQLQADLGSQYSDLLRGLHSNPLPVTLIIKANNPKETLRVASEVKSIPEVSSVNDGAQYVRPLFRVLDIARNIGLVFVLALFLTAMFLISNTIKIAIFSRRREIEIMRLVGATNGFIRMPFLVESTLIGMIGAAVPAAVLGYVYEYLYRVTGGVFYGLHFPLVPATEFVVKLVVALLALGFVIGAWGGFVSVRKFLRA